MIVYSLLMCRFIKELDPVSNHDLSFNVLLPSQLVSDLFFLLLETNEFVLTDLDLRLNKVFLLLFIPLSNILLICLGVKVPEKLLLKIRHCIVKHSVNSSELFPECSLFLEQTSNFLIIFILCCYAKFLS
jgi:hypothetical protein